MRFLNLDLLLSSSPAGPEARVIASPHGRSPNAVSLSLNYQLSITLGSLSALDLQSIGLALYASLTADSELHDLITKNLTAAELEKQAVRLRLQIEPPELRGLPWEALYDDPGGFLSLKDVSIARYIAVGAQTGRPLIAQLPLRVLAVSASPAALPPVNFAAEREHLAQALAQDVSRGWVQVEYVEHGAREAVREAMLQFRPHVFHFVGHGDYADGQAYLSFEKPDGDVDFVNAEAVALLFGGVPELRLIVLNACETAIELPSPPPPSPSGRWGQGVRGLAPKLLQRTGVPAVIAMQAPIPDRAAIAFSRAFYHQLAQGLPLDVAVREGRLAIYNEQGDRATFAIPVLFLSTDEGLLVDFPQQRRERVLAGARTGFDSAWGGDLPAATTQTLGVWRAQMAMAAKLYQRLAAWKALHDLLHEINESAELVRLEIQRLDQAAPDFEFLAEHWSRCQSDIGTLVRFAQRDAAIIAVQPFAETSGQLAGDPWAVEVVVAGHGFEAALNEASVKAVSSAARKLRQTVQTHMNASDKTLRDEADKLRQVAGGWASRRLPDVPGIAEAIAELNDLHAALYSTVERHDIFQDLDNDFARLRDEARRPAWDWEAIGAAWAFCRADVLDSRFLPFAKNSGELTASNGSLAGSEWCVDIARLAGALEAQINAEELAAVRKTFSTA